MKAIVQHGYGTTDVLRLQDVEVPQIGPDEVLVRVRAAALNHSDWFLLTGVPYAVRLAYGLRTPRSAVPGRDVAGHVEAVGANVTRFGPGDEVYAEVDTGSFAEYTRVPANLLAFKPTNLTFEQAAAVPEAANTALQGLRDQARVRPGQRVLINGASGGVGTFAVQIATAFGAEVTGVCSTRNLDLVRSIGADHVIDYTREDFTTAGRRYDVIFDLVGNHSLTDCRRALNRKGTLVLASGAGGRWFGPLGRILRAVLLAPFVSQSLRPFTARRSGNDLTALTKLIEAGKVTPVIDRTYVLSEVPAALRYLGKEHPQAKVVISVQG